MCGVLGEVRVKMREKLEMNIVLVIFKGLDYYGVGSAWWTDEIKDTIKKKGKFIRSSSMECTREVEGKLKK